MTVRLMKKVFSRWYGVSILVTLDMNKQECYAWGNQQGGGGISSFEFIICLEADLGMVDLLTVTLSGNQLSFQILPEMTFVNVF